MFEFCQKKNQKKGRLGVKPKISSLKNERKSGKAMKTKKKTINGYINYLNRSVQFLQYSNLYFVSLLQLTCFFLKISIYPFIISILLLLLLFCCLIKYLPCAFVFFVFFCLVVEFVLFSFCFICSLNFSLVKLFDFF